MSRLCEPATCETQHPCSKCKVPQACTEYYRRKSATPGGRDRRGERTTICKTCSTRARTTWKRDNPEATRQYMHLWRWGLTPEAFDAMLASQGGACAICKASEPGGRGSWHVDHDHKCCRGQRSCGKCIRGLLCAFCNRGLGHFNDMPETLERAADYLRRANVER